MRYLITIAFLFFTASIRPQCSPRINDVQLDVVSHGLWRGNDLGNRIVATPRVDIGLCGRPAASDIGRTGVDFTLEAWVPLGNDGTNLGSARARYLWYFGDLKETTVAAGIHESHWSSGRP